MKEKIIIPEELSGLFHSYNEGFLIDDSLSDLDALIICLYVIEYNNEKAGAKYEELKDFFISIGRKEKPNFAVAIHTAKKKDFLIETNSQLLFLFGGLKKIRTLLGQIGKSPVHVIKSGQNFSAIRLFEEFLNSEMKDKSIKLCDSHVSPSTLFPFSNIKSDIRILTSNIYELEKLKDYIERMKKEKGVNIEIKENKKIHDRFLINGNKCWHIGASIKDLGNKDTVIKEISEVYGSMNDLFEERWAE